MNNPGDIVRARWLLLIRFVLIFAALVLLQSPFLRADADAGLGRSRGPFTDEGLYTAQVRNAMITGRLDLAESDGVIKEPLFALGAWLVLATFGDSMVTMRVAIVLCYSALLALMTAGSGGFSRMLAIAIPVGFLSYVPFHYGHLALAEIPSCIAIVAALFVVHLRLRGAGGWTVPVSSFLVFLAYTLKIQFLYAAAIPPLGFAVALALRQLSDPRADRRAWMDVVASFLVAAGFALLFATVWVLPNQALFSFVLSAQGAERTAGLAHIPRLVLDNAHDLLRQLGVWPVLLLLGLGAVIAWCEWRASARNPQARLSWIALMAPPLAWLVVETHKLGLSYLPSRYVVSLLVAVTLVGAAAIATRQRPLSARAARPAHTAGVMVLALALLINGALYVQALGNRQHVIHEAQQAFAADGRWQGKVVIGPWAPAVFWGTGAITKPVWKNYFNDRDILARLQPAAIVTEADQEDSQQALSRDGITLPARADMILRVHRWELQVFEWPPR